MDKTRLKVILTLAMSVVGCSSAGEEADTSRNAEAFFTPKATTVYQIKSAATGKCIGVVNNSTANNAAVEARTCNGSAGQNFTLASVATGYYAIKNGNSLKCLDVTGKSTADGAAVIQYTCNNSSTNQQWAIADTTGGMVRLTAHHSGKVMEVSLGATADGTFIVQRNWNGAKYQQFQIASGGTCSGQANGTSCGSGQVCYGGTCQAGCYIGGAFVSSGAANAANICQICSPAKSTTGWSNNDGATVACGSCGGTAACVNMAPGSCSKTASTYYRDADGDGYGDPATSAASCSPLSGYVSRAGDCDDGDGYVHPGGLGHCQSYENPNSYDNNTLNTCTSNGTWSQITCPYGCAAGQCRSLETVTLSGQVTCGAVQCPTYQGCAFTSTGGDYHAVCNVGTASYFSLCDGPSDCSGGQVCCYINGIYAHQTQCMDSSSCPYPYNMGLTQGFLVCNPNVGACPAGTTCQLVTGSSAFSANLAFSIYTCR
jgi:hypothetical protein